MDKPKYLMRPKLSWAYLRMSSGFFEFGMKFVISCIESYF